MGDTIEQWRAVVGQWSGGSSRNCEILQHHIAQTSADNGYMYVRFLVLASLLIIGCVELNPGPKQETSGQTGAVPKYRKRTGTVENSGKLYEVKMAAFLFARALNNTEEFQLASNLDGAGAFDDLVFKYRLREPNVCKTCFIQLKHKKKGGTFGRSSLTQISKKFSLLKYFNSYCEIKKNALTEPTLKQCGRFEDFEFVIYTNEKMDSNSPLQGGDSDPLSILSSGSDRGKYIAFDENSDKDIFGFFEQLSSYRELLVKLDSLLKSDVPVDRDIKETKQELQKIERNLKISPNLNSLKSMEIKDKVTKQIDELAKCDFTIYKEFLSKVKIFQCQSNETSMKELIEKELQEACKASPAVTNFIHTKFEECFCKWWQRCRKSEWLNETSELWRTVQKDIITEINKVSKHEIKETEKLGLRFSEEHIKKFSDALKQSTITKIVTNSNTSILQKLKIDQALNTLGYKNPLFIGINCLKTQSNEIKKNWPCKWSDVLIVDCDSDSNAAHGELDISNVARRVLDILQQRADFEQGSETSDENTEKTLVDILQEYKQKLILISTRNKGSGVQKELGNISYLEDNCNILDLDENSQNQTLQRHVNFQGTSVPLSTLVGTVPPERIKALLDSEVLSILWGNKHELSVGKQLDDHCKYYVPRILQHHIYLKEDILKLTDKTITFAVSGLQADELKNYLTAGEKMCEFVYDEREGIHTFKTVYNFSNTAHRAELENMGAHNEERYNIKPEGVRYIILGNRNQESDFNELKVLCRNLHWIHVKGGSFLWRDTNCNIDIIRRHIDNTKYGKYYIKGAVENTDRTKILIAEPGMGKSTFLSYMAHEIKKWDNSVWVLRINLNEYTNELQDTELDLDTIDSCKRFLWNAAHSPEQDALKVTNEIFLHALEITGKLVIILDGYDEISPDYSTKVEMLLRTIRDKTDIKIWISSRSCYRQDLEDQVGKFAFKLQSFTPENQIDFLEKYWSEVTEISKKENLQIFAEQLLSLCSQHFGDRDWEFTGIPLQTMMLGEAFVKEVKEYCCSEEFKLTENFNLPCLFKTFTEKKFDIYFREKNNMDTSKPEVNGSKKDYVEKHKISALQYLLSQKEFDEIRGKIDPSNLDQVNRFLREGNSQKFGIIGTMDGKPYFIHRCFAEYLAVIWYIENCGFCEELIPNNIFKYMNEVTRNISGHMLAGIPKFMAQR